MCVLFVAAEVYVWGRGEYGRLGLGDKGGSSRLRPCKVKAMEGHKVIQASCGGTHTMVLTAEGRIFGWGRGSFGRLGTGHEKDHHSPVEIFLPGHLMLLLVGHAKDHHSPVETFLPGHFFYFFVMLG